MADSVPLSHPTTLLPLRVHPAVPGPDGIRVCADVQPANRAGAPGWWLHFRIDGPIDALSIPAPQVPVAVDGLWRHTCLEAFVQDGEGSGYREFNLSPSGQWAVYRFATERQRCAGDSAPAIGPDIIVERRPDALSVRAWIPRDLLPAVPGRVGLTAVLETTDGRLSYWALQHPHADRPDFHHPAGRALPTPGNHTFPPVSA